MTLNASTAGPITMNEARSASHSLTMAIRANAASTSALNIFIGFSVRAAAFGARLRTSMPTATGISTMPITSTTFPNCSGTTSPVPAKVAIAQVPISGRLTIDSTVLIAVSEIFIATLPPKRWLNRLADTPPGDAASSMRPIANKGGTDSAAIRP